jgi:hypothetical protein
MRDQNESYRSQQPQGGSSPFVAGKGEQNAPNNVQGNQPAEHGCEQAPGQRLSGVLRHIFRARRLSRPVAGMGECAPSLECGSVAAHA